MVAVPDDGPKTSATRNVRPVSADWNGAMSNVSADRLTTLVPYFRDSDAVNLRESADSIESTYLLESHLGDALFRRSHPPRLPASVGTGKLAPPRDFR